MFLIFRFFCLIRQTKTIFVVRSVFCGGLKYLRYRLEAVFSILVGGWSEP